MTGSYLTKTVFRYFSSATAAAATGSSIRSQEVTAHPLLRA
jgi:hypothetical protein